MMLWTTLLLACATPCHAEIYRWVDEQGKVQYSDQPPQSDVASESIDLADSKTKAQKTAPAGSLITTDSVVSEQIQGVENLVIHFDSGPLAKSYYRMNHILVAIEDSVWVQADVCLLYTSPSPRDATLSRMPSSA